MNFFKFMAGVLSEKDGTPSSKRLTAMWVIFLVSALVFTLLYISYISAKQKISLDANVMALLEFIGGSILISLLSFAGLLFGINGFQGFNFDNLKSKLLPGNQTGPSNETSTHD